MTDIVIRDFCFAKDYAAACNLWEHAGPGIQLRKSDKPDEILKKLDRDPDLFLVAEYQGEFAGTVIGGFDGRRGMIYHLAVRMDLRTQGIGKELMGEVETRLKKKGCVKCYLLVTAENSLAMRFYEQRGWSQMNTVRLFGKDL